MRCTEYAVLKGFVLFANSIGCVKKAKGLMIHLVGLKEVTILNLFLLTTLFAFHR